MQLIKCDKCGALINYEERKLWTHFGIGLNVWQDEQNCYGYDKNFRGQLCLGCAEKMRQKLEKFFNIQIKTL